MAKLEKREVVKNVYSLELEQEELDALYLILRRVGGCSETSYRKYSDRIFDVIEEKHRSVIVPYDNNPFFKNSDYLMFADNTI